MHRNRGKVTIPRHIFIFLLAFFLPVDWFSPTGLLFREFGAQPVNVLMLLVAVAVSPNALHRGWQLQKVFSGKNFQVGVLMVLAGGVLGYLASSAFWSYPVLGNKIPGLQFILQGALFACLPLCILTTRYYLSNEGALELFVKCMRWAFIIHLLFFFIDYFAVAEHGNWFYSMFRSLEYSNESRPSGLFSEPSYYGVAVSIYLPFIFFGIYHQHLRGKLFWTTILLVSLLSLILSNSRTGILAVLFQLFVWLLLTRKYRLIKVALIIIIIIFSASYLAQRSVSDDGSGFDLSSVMRIGSTWLSINVAFDGWLWTGIGFGQFHFFYLPVYAPDFLFLSDEARLLFSGLAEYRAHTFNFLTRIILETGIIGFLGWVLFSSSIVTPKRALKTSLSRRDKILLLAPIGAAITLMSQDFYLYLPFYILLTALGLSRLNEGKYIGHEVTKD